jgi:hypothetical protein
MIGSEYPINYLCFSLGNTILKILPKLIFFVPPVFNFPDIPKKRTYKVGKNLKNLPT